MGKVDYGKIRERYGDREKTVPCAVWDGDVTLQRASAEDRMDAALSLAGLELKDDQTPVDTKAMLRACVPLVSKTIVDGDIKPFDSDVGREELINDHAMAVIQLMPAVLEINNLGGNADAAIEAGKKNLETAPSG